MNSNKLSHHGILGMKWGVRRSGLSGSRKSSGISRKEVKKIVNDYNEINGSHIKAKNAIISKGGRTYNGKGKRLDNKSQVKEKGEQTEASVKKPKPVVKPAREMSMQELQETVTRLGLEKRYSELTAPKPTVIDRIKKDAGDVLENSLKSAAQTQLTSVLNDAFSSVIKDAKSGGKTQEQSTEEKTEKKKKKVSDFFKKKEAKTIDDPDIIDADWKEVVDDSGVQNQKVSTLLLEDKSAR